MLEDHMLIGEEDIRAITERLGAPKVYTWYHDFQRVEDWETFVKNASTPRRGEEKTVTEDTVLVMNAGAHASILTKLIQLGLLAKIIRLLVVKTRTEHAPTTFF